MRQRLSYLALLVLPLCAFGPLLVTEFGTPQDFVQLGASDSAAEAATRGIVGDALVDISYHWVGSVQMLGLVRGLGLLLVMLGGVALWQILERGGWSEFDATVLALGVVLLPSSQVVVGWSTAWPAALAALLSLAGFAAAESELEMGGMKRGVGLLGGALLYFGAAMCDFPGALLALTPLAALTLTRPKKAHAELGRWFFTHLAVGVAGLTAADILARWLMHGAGVAATGSLAMRAAEIFLFVLPAGLSGFWAAAAGWRTMVGLGISAAMAAAIFMLVRRDMQRTDGMARVWLLALAVPALAFFCALCAAPGEFAGYRAVWGWSGLVLVGIVGAIRGAGETPAKRGPMQYATLGAVAVLGLLAAHTQSRAMIGEPLGGEWERMRANVFRAKLGGEVNVRLLLPPPDASAARERGFSPRVAHSANSAVQMFHAALRERYPTGLPKGTKVHVETGQTAPPAKGTLLIDLR